MGTADDNRQGKRIYGGGILSSYKETLSCLGSEPVHQPFEVNRVLRTPYRINIVQPIYFVINRLADLQVLGESDLLSLVREAMKQPMHEPLFNKPSFKPLHKPLHKPSD